MANWCNHFVTCTGSAANITKFKKVLQDGIEHMQTFHEATSLGVDIQEAYFFEVSISEQEKPTELIFSYETKWSPNLKDLANVAKNAKLDMVCEYEECSFNLYGKAVIKRDGFIMDDEVPDDFLELIEFDEDTDLYVYNGIEYTNQGDIINEHYAAWKESQLKNKK